MEPADLLADLDATQREAVTTAAAPLCVLAPAGSGKTRVLTRRIAHRCLTGAADPRRVLVLTFTRKAAGELRNRLRHTGLRDDVTAGTFHGIAFAQLRRRWLDAGERVPAIVARRHGLVARALATTGVVADAGAVVAEIDWGKARGLTADTYAAAAAKAGRRPPAPAALVADVFAAYEREKQRRGVVDFDDLLSLCLAALRRDPAFAAAQRWRFQHVFVDELQDVNPLQFRLLQAWLGGRPDVCVVGDPNQAIYGWNGAEPSLLEELPRHLPGLTTVQLTASFRSTAPILAVADAVLGPERRGPRPCAATTAHHDRRAPAPTVAAHPSDTREATAVADHVRRLLAQGRRPADVAVLARTNAQLDLFEQALRSARIPVARPSAAGQPGRRPVRGPLATALSELSGAAPGVSLAAGVRDLLVEARLGDDPVRLGAAEQLAELATEYLAADPEGDGAGLVAWLEATGHHLDATVATGPAVTLSTFHAAKGLEWPVVFVTGIEDGLVPSARARQRSQVAEERRLLHVAITRAIEELHCSWARVRTIGHRPQPRQPSPFWPAIESACADIQPAEPVDWRAQLAEQRRLLRLANAG